MDGKNMLNVNHLTDDELIRYCRTQPLDELADELHRRLEELVSLVEELDENLHRLAEKYSIHADDLYYCDGPSITPPPGAPPTSIINNLDGYSGRPC